MKEGRTHARIGITAGFARPTPGPALFIFSRGFYHASVLGPVYSPGMAEIADMAARTRSTDAAGTDELAALLRATGRGDRDAFARLYQRSASALFAVSLRTLRRRDLAEDVLQEAFLTIWRKAGQYNPDRGRPLAWMITIVRNRAIDRLRAEGRARDMIQGLEEDSVIAIGPNMGEPPIPGHLAKMVRDCIEQLRINYRKSILLAYYYGLTHEELASRLDTPLGTVKSWVRRGLHQLKGCLEQ